MKKKKKYDSCIRLVVKTIETALTLALVTQWDSDVRRVNVYDQ